MRVQLNRLRAEGARGREARGGDRRPNWGHSGVDYGGMGQSHSCIISRFLKNHTRTRLHLTKNKSDFTGFFFLSESWSQE